MVFNVLEPQDERIMFDVEIYWKDDYYEHKMNPDRKRWTLELHAHAKTDGIARYLFERKLELTDPFIDAFVADSQEIEELRGWLWEVYKPSREKGEEDIKDRDYSLNVANHVREVLEHFCEKYDCIMRES